MIGTDLPEHLNYREFDQKHSTMIEQYIISLVDIYPVCNF